jgi:hypothetical protein
MCRGAGDDAVIDLGANDFAVTLSSGSNSVQNLTCQAAFTVTSGGSLTISGTTATFHNLALRGDNGWASLVTAANVQVTGQYQSASAGITGGGGLTLESGATGQAWNYFDLDGPLVNDGTFQPGLFDPTARSTTPRFRSWTCCWP